ncbi:MAG: YgeY family selenium metabolism-linked hydrolase [Candidatus Eisenbacteria bacterium]
MDRGIYDRVLERAELYRDELAEFLAELIRIPSLSCQEERVIGRIRAAMEGFHFDEVRVDGLGSVIGRVGHGPICIAMDAHVDTVDVGNRDDWSFDPHEGRVADGRVWGRGAADQKGGMAALVFAGRILKELHLEGEFSLFVTGTVMEEDCDGLCWQHLIREEHLQPEVCVLTEPTACRVYRGQRGRMEIEIEVLGRSAHASAPERGRNAIYRMAEIVKTIERLAPDLPADPFLGPGSMAVTHFIGRGPSLCAIPDVARAHVDRRLTWGETRESVMSAIRSAVTQLPDARENSIRIGVKRYARAAYTGKVYPTDAVFPAWIVKRDHPAVRAAHETRAAILGGAREDAGEERWIFSTNGVAICGLHGIPCVGFGPGFEEQAHAPDESCPIDHLVKAAAFYASFPAVYGERR